MRIKCVRIKRENLLACTLFWSLVYRSPIPHFQASRFPCHVALCLNETHQLVTESNMTAGCKSNGILVMLAWTGFLCPQLATIWAMREEIQKAHSAPLHLVKASPFWACKIKCQMPIEVPHWWQCDSVWNFWQNAFASLLTIDLMRFILFDVFLHFRNHALHPIKTNWKLEKNIYTSAPFAPLQVTARNKEILILDKKLKEFRKWWLRSRTIGEVVRGNER